MFRNMDLKISIAHFIVVFRLIYCIENGPDCRVAPDPVYHGSFVNCSNRKFSEFDLRKLPTHGVSTLDISYNNIGFLSNYAFKGFKDLKRLMCTRCNLSGMGNFSLKGLDKLEVLHLDHNHLNIMYNGQHDEQPAIPRGVFRYVPMLKELYIDSNGPFPFAMPSYLKYLDIFEYMPGLTHLSMDSFRVLEIRDTFLKFSKLYSLRIHCKYMNSIHDDSLEGFQNSTVKMFELTDGNIQVIFRIIGLNVFQHLPNVSYLSLRNIRVGNQNALLMMKPLAGRKINTIIFDSVSTPGFGKFEDKVNDTVITVDDFHVRNIQVSHFSWYDSDVYSIEYNAILSKAWQHNIKTIVFETSALTRTSILLLFRFMLLRKLESIVILWTVSGMREEFDVSPMTAYEFDFIEERKDQRNKDKHTIPTRQTRQFDDIFSIIDNSKVQSVNTDKHDIEVAQEHFPESDDLGTLNVIHEHVSGGLTIRMPPNLKTIVLDGMHYVHINHHYTILESQVHSIAFTNGISDLQMNGRLYGLENLTSFSLEGSQRVEIGLRFLDAFPILKNLNLKKTCLTPEFYETNGRVIIQNLTALENIDLSDNGLQSLPTDMFLENKQLKYVRLANNRLARIPFSLKNTPILEVLDLSVNSFVDLSGEERTAIDNHILSVKNFTILLGNNEFSCICSSLPFIAWLKSRQHHFDMEGNYTCMSEDGTMSYTGFYMDIDAFWRRCHAKYYLMLSGILACSLVAIYLGIFLGMKKKTEIISKVLQVVVPGFKLKTRRDYLFDVCIGYADQDGTYIREVLLRLLEDKWHLSTFVHQRDLLHDPLEMSDALRDSWRNLLIITEAFLYRYDMALNVMKVASFFVSPSNPRSVVVIVEESVRHRIPPYVLQVVDEDNIVILPRLEPILDYETKEFLRTRLT